MSIANYLTVIRIFVSPIFLVLYLEYETLGIPYLFLPYILFFLLAVSELSDALDGYIARKLNQVSDFGKILDPMADSIWRISIFLAFTKPPVAIPVFLVFVLFYRDCVISTLRTACALRGLALAARPSGKFKAVLQAFCAATILIAMIPHSIGQITLEQFQSLASTMVTCAALYTIYSGYDYMHANWSEVKKLLAAPNN